MALAPSGGGKAEDARDAGSRECEKMREQAVGKYVEEA